MLRAIAHSLLSTLMLATMLWGGCISCPQFFMFAKAKKDCCKAGQCNNSKPQKSAPSRECQRMSLEPAASVHFAAALPALVPLSIDLPKPPPAPRSSPVDAMLPVEHSPPDLQVLNATFLL